MPRIFDNLKPSTQLLPALQENFVVSSRADFCVGYFNLRGWGGLAPYVDAWGADDGPCRVLIGMQRLPHEELREALSLLDKPPSMDNQTAHRLRVQLAEELRRQLTIGTPTNADERTLRQLAAQLRSGKVIVKLFLRHPLHAKLYLLYRDDPANPVTGYLGSSNLTFAGLSGQGELNVDVLDQDAALKLKAWFEDRWNDRFCVDITRELLQIIEESWARGGADPSLPRLSQDGLPPLPRGPRRSRRVQDPPRLRQPPVRLPGCGGQDRCASPEQAQRRARRRRGRPRKDPHGHRRRPASFRTTTTWKR